MFRPALMLCAVLALVACSPAVEDTRPGQPVKTRQKAFKEILRVFEPMGVMLRSDQYDAEKFLGYAQELVVKREVPWPLFAADTNYPPTKAKPAVWSDTPRFERERDAFFAATDALLTAAKTRQKGEVEKAYGKVYDLCQSCHKVFKEK